MGRANELHSFVKIGADDGHIEIELKAPKGKPNLVIRRLLSAKNKVIRPVCVSRRDLTSFRRPTRSRSTESTRLAKKSRTAARSETTWAQGRRMNRSHCKLIAGREWKGQSARTWGTIECSGRGPCRRRGSCALGLPVPPAARAAASRTACRRHACTRSGISHQRRQQCSRATAAPAPQPPLLRQVYYKPPIWSLAHRLNAFNSIFNPIKVKATHTPY